MNTEHWCYVFKVLSGVLFTLQNPFNNFLIFGWNILDLSGRRWKGTQNIHLSWKMLSGLYFIYMYECWSHSKEQAHWRNCILYIDITSERETPWEQMCSERHVFMCIYSLDPLSTFTLWSKSTHKTNRRGNCSFPVFSWKRSQWKRSSICPIFFWFLNPKYKERVLLSTRLCYSLFRVCCVSS